MVLNEADEIKLGNEQVEAIYLGDRLIWTADERFVDVSPDEIWLVDENSIEVVDVKSNTEWRIL